MNAVIGALRVVLGLDTASLESGATKAEARVAKLGNSIKAGLAVAATAAVAAGAAIAAGIKSTIDEADELSKSSAKLGIPIEDLSQLKYVADLSGVSMEGLTAGVKKLSTNLVEAAKGGKGADELFGSLGISATETNGALKSSGTVLMEVADQFAKMPDGVEKSALAVKLFGKAGLDLIPLLNGGAESLREMMKEADALGLTLTAETGTAAENFNDNLSRISYAAQGVVTQLAAALAPTLAVVSEGLVAAARGAVSLLQYLPTIAEYAAVVGAALAVAFAPTILAAVTSLAVAIGTTLVSAVGTLAAVIALNPLGAIAVGIAGAIVAIYHFRDDIKQAIGVDVVALVKSAANLIINSFRAAFEDIKFVWQSLPDIIGAAVIGAVNAVTSGIQQMISKAVGLLNDFVSTANTVTSKLGLEIPTIPAPDFSAALLPNDYADRLKQAVSDRNAKIAEIMSSDPVGQIGTAISQSFGTASSATNSLKTDVDALGNSFESTGGKAKNALDKTKDSTKGAKAAMDEFERSAEGVGQGIGSSFAEAIKGTKSWKDVALDAVQSVLKALVSTSDFGGGIGGGIFKGLLSGLFGFANGGSFQVGGAGGIDSQLVAFKASPNETVSITKPGQSLGGGGSFIYAPVINAPNSDRAGLARLERRIDEQGRGFGTMFDARMKASQTRKTRG